MMTMEIPNRITKELGVTEEDVVNLIISIAESIGPKYPFGFYDIEDIIQECILIGYEGLEKYDAQKGDLENFLRCHMSNRIKNFKRQKYFKPGAKNAESKKNLMNPIDISKVDDEEESSMQMHSNFTKGMIYNEIIDIIDRELPVEYRQDYLKIKSGVEKSVPIKRRKEIINKIKEIVGDNTDDLDEF